MKRSLLAKLIVAVLPMAAIFIALTAYTPEELPNALGAISESEFVNFESAHIHPLDITPDSTKLLAVNTANNTLEVFEITEHALLNTASIPVGMDPVTVRARSNTEAWVVNTISSEISIVDLTMEATVRSIDTEDEPYDVVFAGTPQRAFVSCGHRESVQVFDLSNLDAAPTEVLLIGEQPRAMAVSPDGNTVYTAFFESGNQTTVVSGNLFMAAGICSEQSGNNACTSIPNDVTNPAGPYGGLVPIPNDGVNFDPPLNPANNTPGSQSIIVKKIGAQWLDDNGGDWTNIVSGGAGARTAGWDMPDRDVAVLNANTLSLSYEHHMGNILMGMAVHPVSGEVSVIGTDATNHIRFEPNLNGKFLRVNISQFTPGGGGPTITDLNPHLDYTTSSVAPALREQSIGDPRGMAWRADGSEAYITGMGSNNMIRVDASGNRVGGTIEVGQGPTGLVIDEERGVVYVLNKFGGTISTVDMSSNTEIARANFFDPTPQSIKAGRVHLYGTHEGSGTGHISCASCHVDGKWDRLGWDLGDPSGDSVTFDGIAFHPMKGPKTTQFLIDIIDRGDSNLHWRGDKGGLINFDGAFQHLQGMSAPMDAASMGEFEDLLKNTWYMPNPFRTYRPDGTGSSSATARERIDPNRVRGIGTNFQDVANAGVRLFVAVNVNCAHCHQMNTGRGPLPSISEIVSISGTDIDMTGVENMAPDLRSTYRKIGFYLDGESTAGFGLMADGVFPTWFTNTAVNGDYFGDYENELLSWSGNGSKVPNCSTCETFQLYHESNDVAPAVGYRRTLHGAIGDPNDVDWMRDLLDNPANDDNEYGMIVKGIIAGEKRGFVYSGGNSYQSDEAGVTYTHDQLKDSATTNGPLTWTIVQPNTAFRLGIDEDNDGVYDHDEMDIAQVNIRVMLEGPYDGSSMKGDLLSNGYIPNTDPYGYGDPIGTMVVENVGLTEPVDWVEVELRDAANSSVVVSSISALLQRSGTVMMPTGEQTLSFPGATEGDYFIAVKHRNHLSVMTLAPVALEGAGTLVDFTDPATATYGTDAQKNENGVMMMWAGNAVPDAAIMYTGAGNDRDQILTTIGGTVPSNTVVGYHDEDVNLDGIVKYTGLANDRDIILQSIGGTVPTNTRLEQLP